MRTYGAHAWKAAYDHVSFLSEMIPVSFRSGCRERFGGLADWMLIREAVPFSMDGAGTETFPGIRA